MTETWYSTSGWTTAIDPVIVVSRTQKMVTVKPERGGGTRKQLIVSDYATLHPTFEAAKQHNLKRLRAKLENAKEAYEIACRNIPLDIAAVEAMTEPK